MSAEILNSFHLNWCFLRTKIKCQFRTILVVMTILLQQVSAQNLVLQDTTITTTANFSAKTITAGPNFTIANNGNVILSAETIAIIPQFFILHGGELQVVSGGTPLNVETKELIIPDKFIVLQNFPNPFNPETEIRFALKQESHVELNIYNTVGQHISNLVDKFYGVGFHSVHWNGKDKNNNNVSSGVYFYRIQAGEFSHIRKMSIIR